MRNLNCPKPVQHAQTGPPGCWAEGCAGGGGGWDRRTPAAQLAARRCMVAGQFAARGVPRAYKGPRSRKLTVNAGSFMASGMGPRVSHPSLQPTDRKLAAMADELKVRGGAASARRRHRMALGSLPSPLLAPRASQMMQLECSNANRSRLVCRCPAATASAAAAAYAACRASRLPLTSHPAGQGQRRLQGRQFRGGG